MTEDYYIVILGSIRDHNICAARAVTNWQVQIVTIMTNV